MVYVTRSSGDQLEASENNAPVRVTTCESSTMWTDAGGESLSAGDIYTNFAYTGVGRTARGETVRRVWTDLKNESGATLGREDVPA